MTLSHDTAQNKLREDEGMMFEMQILGEEWDALQ